MIKLIITNYKKRILTATLEGNSMIEACLEEDGSSFVGNIYVGRVEKIVKNINAAFIEVAPGLKGYYSLEENKNHLFLNRKNTGKVCEGDLLLVQVERDAVKTKAMILTSRLNLSGKYIVVNGGISGIHFSEKISGKKMKKILTEFLLPFCSEEFGMIVRTNTKELFESSQNPEDAMELLKKEALELTAQFQTICSQAQTRTAFTLMHGNRPAYLNSILNARTEELEEIITDDQTVWQEIQSCQDESILKKLRLYKDSLLSLSKLYRIEEQLTDALKERVWLKSGGYLVIQPTEALTVIDVNTGKCIQSKNNREEAFFKVNREAAIEIAKQLRLRNYSGIILIDFIDMKESCHNTELLELLSGMVLKDPVKTTVVDITKLGLVELTRKKIRKPLYEQLQ